MIEILFLIFVVKNIPPEGRNRYRSIATATISPIAMSRTSQTLKER